MTSRFFYHFFWNFYDYLGSYLLLGGAVLLVWIGAGTLAGAGLRLSGWPLMAAAGSVAGLVFLFGTAYLSGGIFDFAVRAARDEAARLNTFKAQSRQLLGRYLRLLALAMIALAVIVSNVAFYLSVARHAKEPLFRVGGLGAALLFVWVFVGLLLFLHVMAAMPARYPEEVSIRTLAKRAFLVMVLSPGLWITATITSVVATAACALSVVGTIMIVPLLATASATALEIAEMFASDLAKARAELGEKQSVRAYKMRALEKGLAWEARQPRRTLRELIRPWEN